MWRTYIDVAEQWYPDSINPHETTPITSLQEAIDRALWQPRCRSEQEQKNATFCDTPSCTGAIVTHIAKATLPEVLMLQRHKYEEQWSHGMDERLTIGHTRYKLAGVIFYTGGHFTAAVHLNGQWFGYNDMDNMAKLVHIPGGLAHVQQSSSVDGHMHVWIFNRIDTETSSEVTMNDYVDENAITTTPAYFHMFLDHGQLHHVE